MSDIQCPDAGTWKTFLDGDVLDDAAADLAAHLEDCEACQQTLERLAAGKETWEGTAKQLADADAANVEAGIESSGHLQGVLDDLKQGIDFGASATASSRDVLRFLDPSDEPGSIGRLDLYEILEVVGAGGMGVVLRGWDPTLRRVVAIKVLAAHLANSAAAERRFVREAQAAAAVSHDHVVAIHAVEAGHEPPYLVMQFVEGKTLQQRLDRTGPLNVNEILRIGQQTALGLAAAHRQGIVHRDIKPANILLENGVERVRITDFGLARAIDDASMTQSGVVAGTPLFMAPEQAQGQPVDHRSDLFSLGSVLYAMTTGRPPFRSSTMMGVIRRVCDDQPRPIREINPDIPDWLCGIIDRLLLKNPAERFQTADEVAELLAGCLAHVQRPLNVQLPEACRVAAIPKHDEEIAESTRQSSGDSQLNESSTDQSQAVAESPSADSKRDRWAVLTSLPTKQDVNARQRFLSADEVEREARRLIRFPALMIAVSGLGIAWETISRFPSLADYDESTVVYLLGHQAWNLLSILVCLLGAVSLLALRNRTLGYMAAVIPMFSYLTLPLGLPAGFWALMQLARPEVIRGFEHRAGRYSSEPLAVPDRPALGRILARLLLLVLLAITGALVRFAFIVVDGFSPREKPLDGDGATLLVAAAVSVLVGLIALYRYGYGSPSRTDTSPARRTPRQGHLRRTCEVVLCVFLACGTMIAIFSDLTAKHYNRLVEDAVLPLIGVTIAVLGIVVFINRRRIRELTASGQEDPELTSAYRTAVVLPLGLLVPVILLLALWEYRQSTVGYVAFDVDNPMSIVSFRNVETDKSHTLSASWKRIRLPAGTYEWSVSESPIQNMLIDSGTIEVQPRVGQLISTRIDKAEALRRLVGTWKYVSGNVKWDASNGPAPRWAQPPKFFVIHQDLPRGRSRHSVGFVLSDETANELANGIARYSSEFRADGSPKSVSLFSPDPDIDPQDWPCVAQGYWQIGQNGLFLILGPAGELRLPNTYSVPTDRYVRYQFERVLEESVPEESSVEISED